MGTQTASVTKTAGANILTYDRRAYYCELRHIPVCNIPLLIPHKALDGIINHYPKKYCYKKKRKQIFALLLKRFPIQNKKEIGC